jgi:hypothetical protein
MRFGQYTSGHSAAPAIFEFAGALVRKGASVIVTVEIMEKSVILKTPKGCTSRRDGMYPE